jgi:hypothetical protein
VDVERDALLESLRDMRAHVTMTLDGLSAVELLTPMLPSGWSCLGLVRHLAKDVEEFWFCDVVAGEPFDDEEFGTSSVAAWRVAPDVDPADVFHRYAIACEHATEIIETSALEARLAHWPEYFPNQWLFNVRDVLHHVIGETAVHCGHLDVARELLDGRQFMVMPDGEG